MMMQYRRVGRTDLQLSVIGLGSAQLQMLSREEAHRTLARAFEHGVNWVHSAPDYGGVEPWIARAIGESAMRIHVLAQDPGPPELLEPYFEQTCSLFGNPRLELYGLGCIDDAERIGQNVWDRGGKIESLQRKKAEGRLGGVFCTTHGSPEYVERLITSGVFDAIMLAYNPIGFHLLTYDAAKEGRDFERMAEHRDRLFPLAARHGVSILVMKALAGGMLVPGRGLPPHGWFGPESRPSTTDLLRYVLAEPAVCTVVVGAASPAEAEENARAGHAPLALAVEARQAIERYAAATKLTVCSRCGECESTCSRDLPISAMFRDAYIWNYRTETFMADDRFNYLHLHPEATLACATCTNQTCRCPQGLSVPIELARIHEGVGAMVGAQYHPGSIDGLRHRTVRGRHQLMVLTSEVESTLEAGGRGVARFFVENTGEAMWTSHAHVPDPAVAVAIGAAVDGRLIAIEPIRQNVSPGQRSHLVIELPAPHRPGRYDVQFALMPLASSGMNGESTTFHRGALTVTNGTNGQRGIRRFFKPLAGRTAVVRATPAPFGVVKPPQYGATFVEHTIPSRVTAGETTGVRVTIGNASAFAWRSQPEEGHPVEIAVYLDDDLYSMLQLPRAVVAPGESVTLHFALRIAAPGRHAVRLEPVHQHVAWFANRGVPPLAVAIDAEPVQRTATARAFELSLRHNLWHYQPTQGIARSRDGRPFPLFTARAKGCRIWDTEGHEYLDYTMSWGATILGHADDRVQHAIRGVLDSGPLPPFPHPMEMEVSRMLTEDFPCGDMVVFGKNGSDVCTLAARFARLATGRPVILSCGFHGWQDFALDYFDFAGSGIPKPAERVLHKFRFNDERDFRRLYDAHRGSLAAVMIEPSGPAHEHGLDGDADPEFLATIARAARDAGALLIFDEIITGYRYPGHSVQRAAGVSPDLTCVGKALASGMPLSALVGPRRLFFDSFFKTHYCPTFKGEIYSFAAAQAAIEIYRREPVASHLWQFGEELQRGIDRLCSQLGVDAACQGPPFRFGLFFHDADAEVTRLKRTLWVQELLKAGIVTVTGIMLPSYAHGDAEMRATLQAAGTALEAIARASTSDDLHRQIEIPLL